jgi:hypothetical protein
MDETDPGKFMTNWNGYSREARDAVGQLNVHTYGTGDRRRVRDLAKAEDKPLWMSEVGGSWAGNPALGDTTGAWDRSNINNGLGIAGRMVDDLRELEPGGWVFWQPVEDTYKQEHGNGGWGSIYVDFDCNYEGREGFSNRRLNDGDSAADAKCKVLTNQKYNTTRNFTHYIRPGDFLIQNDNAKTASALRADGNGATLVHFNDTAAAETVTVNLANFANIAEGATVTPVVTTKSPLEDIERNALVKGTPVAVDRVAKAATLEIPAASVVTFLVDGVSGVAEDAAPVKDGHSYHLTGEASGKVLTGQPGSAVTVEDPAGTAAATAAQTWTFHAAGAGGAAAGEYSHDRRWVVTNANGSVLTGTGGILNGSQAGTTALSAMGLDEARRQPSAQWIVTTENGNQWSLVNAAAAIALQPAGGNTGSGSAVGLASSAGTTSTARGSAHQAWAFQDLKDLVLLGIQRTELSTPTGVVPSLPETVTPLYAKGAGRPIAVQWEDVDPALWGKPGTVTLRGSGVDLYGRAFADAQLVVTVGDYVATDPVSVTVGSGSSVADVQAAAPATVPGQIGTGPARNALPVAWDWSTLTADALQSAGTATRTVTVTGTATPGVAGQNPLPAVLTVIVVGRTTSSNICRDDTSTVVTASFTEGGYAAANTCDGNTATRWSNWVGSGRAGDSLAYAFSRDYLVDSVTVTLAERAAESFTVQYQDAGGAWKDTTAGTVTGLSTTAPRTVSFDPVTTRGIRVVLVTTGSYTKVADVAISGSRLADSGVAGLGRLMVNQQDVAGFSTGTADYRVLTPREPFPVVAASPLDTDAKVTVQQATAESPSAAVTVTAPDGTVKVYRVDFDFHVVLGSKDGCKDGGWATSTLPVFRNQGECVSHFGGGGGA